MGHPVYTTLNFLALQGAPYIYGISRLRVKNVFMRWWPDVGTIAVCYSSTVRKQWQPLAELRPWIALQPTYVRQNVNSVCSYGITLSVCA
jgi:hypothetical protein